jgi:hypothetical protein
MEKEEISRFKERIWLWDSFYCQSWLQLKAQKMRVRWQHEMEDRIITRHLVKKNS